MADTQEKPKNTRSLLIYGAVVALAIAGLVAVFLWAGSTDYRVLYTGLSDDDMSAIITKLREKRIPYKVEAGLIKVPEDRLYEVRIELAGEGLPRGGGVGFEIFDKTGFGITEFAQKVNYVRALQGELARTITQMRKVEGARVHLVLPEDTAFLEEEKKARASVVVKLKPGVALTGSEVQSIVHLVASSLPELSPEDITLVDTQGRLWTRPEEGEEFSQVYIARKRELERELEQKVQTMLERAVGKGKVVARVSVELEAKRVETTEESFDPDSQVARSEQRTLEKSTGMTEGGIPGVVSNTPGGTQQPQSATGMRTSQRQNEIINYEISRKISKTVEPDGRIKRVAVAVLIDGKYETITKDDGTEEKKYIPRTEEEINKFTNIVKNAVGFSEERGDTVTVENIPFAPDTVVTTEGVEATASMIPPYLIKDIIRIAIAGVLMLVIFLFVIRPIIRRVVEENRALDSIQKSLAEGRLALEKGEDKKMLESGRGGEAERLKELVRQNPQQAAIVIKNWLKE